MLKERITKWKVNIVPTPPPPPPPPDVCCQNVPQKAASLLIPLWGSYTCKGTQWCMYMTLCLQVHVVVLVEGITECLREGVLYGMFSLSYYTQQSTHIHHSSSAQAQDKDGHFNSPVSRRQISCSSLSPVLRSSVISSPPARVSRRCRTDFMVDTDGQNHKILQERIITAGRYWRTKSQNSPVKNNNNWPTLTDIVLLWRIITCRHWQTKSQNHPKKNNN